MGENDNRIPIEISARHVHLSQSDVEKLFGRGYHLKPLRPISQAGQYLCVERVNLINNKSEIERVAILGPTRDKTQVEISMTDAHALGLNPPVRLSGNLEGAQDISIKARDRTIEAMQSVIIAQNHIHMSTQEAKRMEVDDGGYVQVVLRGARPIIFEKVIVRVDDTYTLCMHIDIDEANACCASNGTQGELLRYAEKKGEMRVEYEQLTELVVKEVMSRLTDEQEKPEYITSNPYKKVLVLGDVTKFAPGINHDISVSSLDDYQHDRDIESYDRVYITELTNTQLCDIALGRDESPFAEAVIKALSSGKSVYLAETAPDYRRKRQTIPAELRNKFEGYEKTLRGYGILPMVTGYCGGYDSTDKVISESIARRLCKGEKKLYLFPKGTIITPLAKDVFNAARAKFQLDLERGDHHDGMCCDR